MVFKYTGKRKMQCLYNGMILMLGTHFIYAGDLLDYRMDYVVMCLFCIFMLAWGITLITNEKKYFIIAALASGAAVFVRFNVVVYIVLAVVVSELVKMLFKCSNFKKSFLNILQFGCFCILGGGWSALTNLNHLLLYYLVNHAGGNAYIWENSGGFWSQILYYPIALGSLHLGWILLLVGLVLYAAAIIKCCFFKYDLKRETKVSIVSLSLIMAMQLLILTMDKVKINTTASIMVGVWLAIITIIFNELENNTSKIVGTLAYLFIISVVVLGIGNYAKGTTTRHFNEYDKHIDDIYAAVDAYVSENEQSTYVYLWDMDGTYDLMLSANLRLYQYEKRHKQVKFRLPLTSAGYDPDSPYDYVNPDSPFEFMNPEQEFDVDTLMQGIEESDIVCITKEGYGVCNADYKLNSCWEKARSTAWESLQNSSKFTKLIETDVDGYPVAVYGKKKLDLAVTGTYQDGWSGENIQIGNYDSDYDVYVKFLQSAAAFKGESGNVIEVYVNDKLVNTQSVDCQGEAYKLTDLLAGNDVHGDKIEFKVQKVVCPLEEGLSEDGRKLGVMLSIYQ